MCFCQVITDPVQSQTMQQELECFNQWALSNNMKLNPSKCNFMFINFERSTPNPPTLQIGNSPINRTDSLKILGVLVQENLKWDNQIDSMCKAFSRRLFYLRQLKRCGIPIPDLFTVYVQYIRPTLEYATPVWHSGLSKKQQECLEHLQRKAFRIILSYDYCANHSYSEICSQFNIPPLFQRRQQLCASFGKSLLHSHKFRHWLPPTRNNGLRNNNHLSSFRCRTNRYKGSTIPYLIDLINHSAS